MGVAMNTNCYYSSTSSERKTTYGFLVWNFCIILITSTSQHTVQHNTISIIVILRRKLDHATSAYPALLPLLGTETNIHMQIVLRLCRYVFTYCSFSLWTNELLITSSPFLVSKDQRVVCRRNGIYFLYFHRGTPRRQRAMISRNKYSMD